MSTPALLIVLTLALPGPQEGAPEAAEPPAGWIVRERYRAAANADGDAARGAARDEAWHASYAAFALGAGELLHPAQAAGPSQLTFETRLRIPDDADFRFHLEVVGGQARLELRDEAGERLEWLVCQTGDGSGEWLTLAWGDYDLRVVFERSGTGRAALRTLWEQRLTERGGFLPEPVPTARTRVPEAALDALAASEDAFHGRLLLARKGCTNCHDPGPHGLVGERPAPPLAALGGRAHGDWIARWIADPESVRAHADMPRLVDEEAALDLTGYLLGLSEEEAAPAAVATEDAVLDRGRALYHRLGCVACHGALDSLAAVTGDPFQADTLPSAVPVRAFGDLRGKWKPEGLRSMLLDPRGVHPDGRMPDMSLSEEEADLLASYLMTRFGGSPSDRRFVDPGVEPGHELFVASSCSACHALALGGERTPPHAPPLAQLDPERGCLDPEDAATPRYSFNEVERRQLTRALAFVAAAEPHPAPLDQARLQVEVQSCFACHTQDGRGGPPPALGAYFVSEGEEVDMGDEGRLPPDLTSAGFKLTTTWLDAVLLEGARGREYLAARMPQYGEEHVGALAAAFARLEGLEPHSDAPEPEATDALVSIGRELMGRTALGCIACHVYKDHPAVTMPGPAIDAFGERLRWEWFLAYLQDPARYKRGTRMPAFARGNQSNLKSVLDGNYRHQVEAMWAYFSLGEFMPTPDGIQPVRGTMRVTPEERPRVLRAFLEDAGSRAIAVGFPGGVHVAFDAEAVRLAAAWRGDFVDASGAWAGRGGSILGGRGEALWTAPEGAGLWIGRLRGEWPADSKARFRGYRLDAGGVPTFHYELAGVRVAERLTTEATPTPRVRRSFELRGLEPGVPVLLPLGTYTTSRVGPGLRTGFDGEHLKLDVLEAADVHTFELEIVP